MKQAFNWIEGDIIVLNLTLFDPDEEWTVHPDDLHSKSKNSAFLGSRLFGRVKNTILGGDNVTPTAVSR